LDRRLPVPRADLNAAVEQNPDTQVFRIIAQSLQWLSYLGPQ
jgi:hypothetical protein